jgi:putative transposase
MKYEPLKEDSYYHVYNRGNNKEDIFIEEKNYGYFLLLMTKYISPVCSILAYCLLKNHFHLLIKTNETIESKVISQAFSNFFNSYSKSINKTYNRTGSLFQDRFSRIKVEEEIYLKNLILYIHLNPTNHGLVRDFSKYKHASYQSIISVKPTKLEREFVIKLFDDVENFIAAHTHYKIKKDDMYYLE